MGFKKKLKSFIEARGNIFVAPIRKLVFSAVIYFVWQERNDIIFNPSAKDWRVILKKSEDNLCEASWRWSNKS